MRDSRSGAVRSAIREGYRPGPIVRPPDFTRQSACKDDAGQNDSLLFPSAEPSERRLRRVGLLFCDECPVRQQCLELGQSTGSEGIFGGQYLASDAAVREGNLRREVIERVREGESDGSIARMTGLAMETVTSWRRAEGLTGNPPYGSGLTNLLRGTA